MILCVGLAADDTFRHTIAGLARERARFDVLDLAQLAYSGSLSIPLADWGAGTLSLHAKRYELGAYDGAYVRLHDIAREAPTEVLATRAAGLYRTLCRAFTHAPLRVVNPPLRDRSNFAKLYHAAELATAAGWQVPRSCLTDRPDDARAFLATCDDGAIFKGVSGAKTWATYFDPNKHTERLALLPRCPVLFQERIIGPDVRIHAIGDEVFAESIESESIDYRSTRANSYRGIDVPVSVGSGCHLLQQQSRTPFLGIDFKIQRSTGEWFFLEANPMPAYEGYDRRVGGAISGAIVRWLTQPGA